MRWVVLRFTGLKNWPNGKSQLVLGGQAADGSERGLELKDSVEGERTPVVSQR